LDIGVVIGEYRLNNLRFADDIAAICNNNQGLDTIVTSMSAESRRSGPSTSIKQKPSSSEGILDRVISNWKVRF